MNIKSIETKRKSVLIVAYFFPPIYGAESIQISNYVKHLISCGWKVGVISTGNYAQEQLDLDLAGRVAQEVCVYRPYSIKNIITKFLGTIKLLPDEKAGWIPFALFHIEKVIQKEMPEIIYSRSTPISSHIIAFFIKKKTGLPWVAFSLIHGLKIFT